MQDVGEQIPSERDEQIYEAWESGKKTPRVLAHQFGVSRMVVEQAIDRCLPVFNSQNQMRAYKREIHKLEDVGTVYYGKAMEGDIDSAHVYARINERYCAMQGWSSVNIRLDPYQAQVQEEPSSYEKITEAIMRIARPERFANNGTGPALAPFASDGTVPRVAPSTDDQNGADSERFSTRNGPECDKGAT